MGSVWWGELVQEVFGKGGVDAGKDGEEAGFEGVDGLFGGVVAMDIWGDKLVG